MTNALAFNDVKFSVIDKNNQIWLRASEIAKALGYKEENAITKIYNRHQDEFTENMTQVIEIVDIPKLGFSENLKTKIRIFSLRGCHLLAMFARTAIAKDFRKWVLDVLERNNELNKPKPLTLSTAKERKPLKTLVEAWAKQSGLLRSGLWTQVNTHFKVESITKLPMDWLQDAITFVQMKIDALPKTLSHKNKIIPGQDILNLIGEKYDLGSLETFILGEYQVKKILDQNPNVGEHTLKAIMLKAKYMKTIAQVYHLSVAMKNDIDAVMSKPIAQARETLNKTNICTDSFIYTMHSGAWDILKLGKDFSDIANSTIRSSICFARMQDL